MNELNKRNMGYEHFIGLGGYNLANEIVSKAKSCS
jgi:hypothetical protein